MRVRARARVRVSSVAGYRRGAAPNCERRAHLARVGLRVGVGVRVGVRARVRDRVGPNPNPNPNPTSSLTLIQPQA